jgi:acetoin utilization deacetylase AcuC-like enzyme
MKTVYSPDHALRAPATEFFGGQLIRPHECPERMDVILAEMAARGHPPPGAPLEHGLDPVLRVHARDYVAFLQTCWADWQAAGYRGEAFATTLPTRRMPGGWIPREIDGRIGVYCLSAETAISAGTWEAAFAGAQVALTAAGIVAAGDGPAFALSRPPGHHAPADMFGGFCFLNNAAIATEELRARGAGRVAILDVDFHHGNGTQDIFYARGDVLFCSLHGDPAYTYPYFLGRREETGAGAGAGSNANYPMPPGTGYGDWALALDDALGRIARFGADALVVSFGADTFREDPISFFRLDHDDYSDMGRRIGRAGLPTLVVMEGGYAVADLGINTANFIEGVAHG